MCRIFIISFFFFNDTATTEIYTLSLHDALPISSASLGVPMPVGTPNAALGSRFNHLQISLNRSEEHTSELQSPCNLVCRLLLEKKKKRMEKLPLFQNDLPFRFQLIDGILLPPVA